MKRLPYFQLLLLVFLYCPQNWLHQIKCKATTDCTSLKNGVRENICFPLSFLGLIFSIHVLHAVSSNFHIKKVFDQHQTCI